MVIVAATVVFLAKAEVVVSAAVLCVNTLPTLALKILRLEQIVLHHLHLPHTLQAGKLSPLHISRRNLSYCNSNIRILLFPINKRNSTGFKFLADRVQQFVREKKTISLVPFFYPFNISYIDLIENTSIVCWWQCLVLLLTIAVAVGWVLCIACHTVSRGATCASSRITLMCVPPSSS